MNPDDAGNLAVALLVGALVASLVYSKPAKTFMHGLFSVDKKTGRMSIQLWKPTKKKGRRKK